MQAKTMAYSRLPNILTERRYTVADLIKMLAARGQSFDKKTVYRLASAKPLHTINGSVLGAVCKELNVGVGEIIAWEPPKTELHRLDETTQERLSFLMGRNNEGKLTKPEAAELMELGAYAEKLSLENARMLAEIAGSKSPTSVKKPTRRPKSAEKDIAA